MFYLDNQDRVKQYYLHNRDRTKENHMRNHDKIIARRYIYSNKRYKTDNNFRLTWNLQTRKLKAFKAQNVGKTNKIFDFLGCSHSFLKLWIESQLHGEMILENYGKILCLDHCPAVASFNLLDRRERKEHFNWLHLRPMYVKIILLKLIKLI